MLDANDVRQIKVRESLEETKAHDVRFKETKTASGRRDVSLPDIVVDVLRDHRRQQLELRMAMGLGRMPDDALVFPALDGGPQAPRQLSGDWREVREAAGVEDVTFHALRHTHASQLIDAGVDIVTISKRLGHASPAITLKVYAHLFQQRDDKASAAINAAMTKLGVHDR
jgi:integrase